MSKIVQSPVPFHLPRNKKIDIEFENITYAVSNGRKGKKEILKGVSGKFKSGELTAIMGPSGAGKTTLLNVLTGFQSNGMKGAIKSIGSLETKIGSKQYKKESCYILQDDQLVPFFTVSEIMNISANLKLAQNMSDKVKEVIINEILQTLGLSSCRDTRCGQLSGGQKKRLSIALELVNNPPIMFLDEPTTGLDSSSSLQCINMLKKLASGGRTIICTIHQPSASMYDMFDHVYAMADGKCIYKGASANTVPYLTAVGLHCPEYHNPADYLLEVANGEHGNFTEHLSEKAKALNWRSVYSSSRLEAEEEVGNVIHEFLSMDHPTKEVNALPSEWAKFLVLINRSLLQLYRDWTVTHLKLLLHTIIGIFIGLFYFNSGNDASKTLANFGYLLVTCVYLCYTSIMPAVLRFPSELPVLKKEKFNNWYDLKTYYFAFMVADIPIQILFCISYTTISYFMSSQPSELNRYVMFLLICCLVTIAAESFGIFLGTVVNPINGTFLGAISVALMLTLAGFLVYLTHMSAPFYYLSYISYLRYGLQGLVYSVYGQNRPVIPCPEEALYCHYNTPATFLKEIGMANINYWLCAGALCLIIVFLRVLAYCTLKSRISSG
ncbi:hypothetical protein FQR65_LT00550 [Abscondita terminalis]|nr:hypothetical protein FQR65_LT00550 [Abscondita terminalis]